MYAPGHEQLGDVVAEGVRHVLGADVGDALEREADVDRVAARQVVLDGLDDELHQLAVGRHQHRDEQVALQQTRRQHVWEGVVVL